MFHFKHQSRGRRCRAGLSRVITIVALASIGPRAGHAQADNTASLRGYAGLRDAGRESANHGDFNAETYRVSQTSAVPRGDVVLCPANSLFTQSPTLGEGFSAGVSEVNAGITRYDRFRGVSGEVTSIRWWGFELIFIPPGTFLECEESDPTFQITFHEDYGSAPGPAVCSYTLVATRTPSGLFYGGEDNPLELVQYDVTLPTPCFMVRGYLSIVGAGDAQCRFYWLSSEVGNGSSHCGGCQSLSEYDLSFCLIGAPGTLTGACCDELAASCQDDVIITSCVADYQRFAPNTTCASLMPKCGELKGSCCFDDGRPCSNIAQYFCEAVGGAWSGPGSLCDACPASGACCQGTTLCSITLEADCLAEGHSWLGAGSSCSECPALPDCDSEGTLFGQRPFDPIAEIGATTSESASNFTVYENFAGVAGPITGLKWWGFDLHPVGNGFVECVETNNTFAISFHEDAAGQPGNEVFFDLVSATRTPTNIRYNGAELNEYEATLITPFVMTRGWVSIVGVGDPTCWFLWVQSPQGDDAAFCEGCIPQQQGSDYAYCLKGTAGGVSGACCDQTTGVCMDEKIDITDCLSPDQRFKPNATCDSFVPPCGESTGACCQPLDFCQITSSEVCASLGGNWQGSGSICSQCPCAAFCPPNGIAEPEPVCGEGFTDSVNGGCNTMAPAFTPILLGQNVCGSAGHYPDAEGGEVHDEDWYELSVNGQTPITWSIFAEGPVEGWIILGDAGCPGTVIDNSVGVACQTLSLFAFAEGPGTYWLVVSGRGITDASGCPMRYVATVESPFGCPPGDVNSDAFVDGRDIAFFVSCLLSGAAPGGNCQCADMNFSGGVTSEDVPLFVEALVGS